MPEKSLQLVYMYIFHMSESTEMLCDRWVIFKSPAVNVTSVAMNALVQRLGCVTLILQAISPALQQIDDVA